MTSLGMISRLTVLILTLWNVMFLTAADLRTGFEQAPIGEILEIKTAVGSWTAATVKMLGHLVFQSERWTSRNPFQFRIEERMKGKWWGAPSIVALRSRLRATRNARAFSTPSTRKPRPGNEYRI